LNFELGNKGVE